MLKWRALFGRRRILKTPGKHRRSKQDTDRDIINRQCRGQDGGLAITIKLEDLNRREAQSKHFSRFNLIKLTQSICTRS
jgi:hypothetical protein